MTFTQQGQYRYTGIQKRDDDDDDDECHWVNTRCVQMVQVVCVVCLESLVQALVAPPRGQETVSGVFPGVSLSSETTLVPVDVLEKQEVKLQ